MVLITNDNQLQQIPLQVEGNVISALTVSPAALTLGVVQPGQKISRNIIVRGKEPFRVTGVQCGDDCFQFDVGNEQKPMHLIPVSFTAGNEPGQVTQEIEIVTDNGLRSTILATATIRDAEG
jgi:hypothetical protein